MSTERPVRTLRGPSLLAVARALAAVMVLVPACGGAADDAPAPPSLEPGPPAAAGATDRDTLLVERELAQAQFLRLMEEKRYAEAETIATQIVRITTQLSAEQDIALASPLKNLATAQLEKGDLTAAATNYQACIDLVERRAGVLSERLTDPLLGLGKAYLKSGRYEDSRLAYERALQVNHANEGFYNLEQLPIRDGLSEALLGLDNEEDADFQQETQVAIQRHRTGEASVELVPALIKLARWQQRTERHDLANLNWRFADEILRKTGHTQDPEMIEVLLGRSDSARSTGQFGSGLAYLKRALELVDARPMPDRARRGELLVEIGDTNMVLLKTRTALDRYAEAWKALSEDDPALIARRDALLGQPVLLAGPMPDALTRTARKISPRERAGALAEGIVLARLAVDEQGFPHDVVVEESNPPRMLDDQVVGALRKSLFRPRFVDGVAVATPVTRYRHEFRFARSELAGKDKAHPDKSGERIGVPPEPTATEQVK